MENDRNVESFAINSKCLAYYLEDGKVMTPVAVKKSGSEIFALKLDDGRVVDRTIAVELCHHGLLANCSVAQSKTGDLFVRSLNDGNPDNNLSNLPEF